MVWGKPLPGETTRELIRPSAPAPVSPTRVLAGLAVVGVVTWVLEGVVGLGPGLEVVLAAALGSALAVRVAHLARHVAVVTLVVVALIGLGWVELINKAQYGTLALSGAPPLVRWCGTTYEPSGVVTAEPSTGGGPPYTQILRTPSGYDVFGVALGGHRACGAPVPLFVRVGAQRYRAYDPARSVLGGGPPPTATRTSWAPCRRPSRRAVTGCAGAPGWRRRARPCAAAPSAVRPRRTRPRR